MGRRAFLGAVAAAAGLGTAPALARPAGPARWRATQALIDGYVARGAVPGAIVGIVEVGRFRPVWLRAGTTDFGNGQPVDERTLWRIFSMTKPVTGVAVMQQAAAGRLTLDTPLSDICPEFASMRVLVDPAAGLESRPAKRPILVRHLLTHSAGFTYTINGNGPLEREYRRLGIQPMSAGSLASPGDTPAPELRTYLERLATLPLAYEPGTRYLYSVALDVAGGMLERLTGQPLDRLFQAQLFGPLGMRDTAFWLDAQRLARLAAIHAWADPRTGKPLPAPVRLDHPTSDWAARPVMLAGGAGLISSAEDYARFVQMLLNEGLFEGRRLLPAAAARRAMRNQLEPGTFLREIDGYGAGAMVALSDRPVGDPRGPARSGRWGWGGAAGTLFQIDPVAGRGVVLMLQSFGNPNGPTADRDLPRALAQDLGDG